MAGVRCRIGVLPYSSVCTSSRFEDEVREGPRAKAHFHQRNILRHSIIRSQKMPKGVFLMFQNTNIYTTRSYTVYVYRVQLPQSHSIFFVEARYIVTRAELVWLVGWLSIWAGVRAIVVRLWHRILLMIGLMHRHLQLVWRYMYEGGIFSMRCQALSLLEVGWVRFAKIT